MFHPANVVRELNCVADDVLVFENDVDACDDISHQSLRAEPHREAGETRKR